MSCSKELEKVFQTVLSVICNDIDEGISCKDLFIAMALTKESYAEEVISRLGINSEIAKSFVMSQNAEYLIRYLSKEAELAIKEAQKIAEGYGYKNICSHHLLQSIIKSGDKTLSQMLVDYDITYNKIKDIIEAMSHNRIGKEDDNYNIGQSVRIASRIKDKKLEKELINTFLEKNKNNK